METLDVARWQFAITTIYHFLLVPITIGLSGLVALMQTQWVRTGDERYLRMTRFWGKLLLINFALGVATGIVQEFQFGMAWSEYSRFVGDVFGAPLAIEGLAAFFLESTFLGLWIFGWDRLPRRIHLGTIWAVFIGTCLSAYFILAANAWMQRPVGAEVNPDRGRAELTSIWEVLTNKTARVRLRAHHHRGGDDGRDGARGDQRLASLAAARHGVRVLLHLVALGAAGHARRRPRHDRHRPLLRPVDDEGPADEDGCRRGAVRDDGERRAVAVRARRAREVARRALVNIEIPGLLSFMATDSFNGTVEGINDIQAEYEQRYGPGDYVPVLGLTYWSFRIMIGLGLFMVLLAAAGLWIMRRGRDPGKWFTRLAVLGLFAPLVANSAGWIFTEAGRQPWVVQGLLRTADGVSPIAQQHRVVLADPADAALRRAGGDRGVAVRARGAARPRSGANARDGPRWRVLPARRWRTDMDLQTLWFVLIAVLWSGYLILEGFDFGVGMLMPVVGRTESERGQAVRSIVPVWDGNEVWLLVAGGATFAAFPEWYATLFSGFYLALTLILVALIVRVMALEYRNKHDDARLAQPLGRGDRRLQRGARAAVGRRLRQHRRRQPARRGRRLRRGLPRPAARRTRSWAG